MWKNINLFDLNTFGAQIENHELFPDKTNVEIVEVPGDPENNALHITAKQESGPGIVDQWGNPLNYGRGTVENYILLNNQESEISQMIVLF